MIAHAQSRHSLPAALARLGCLGVGWLAFSPTLLAQMAQTAQPSSSHIQPSPAKAATAAAAPLLTEDDLRRQLVGKTWYLRGRELGDSLRFSMRGQPLDHVDTGSYTLCLVRVEKVQLTHKRLELDGARYALHFLGALPYEDPQKSAEEIRITPRKKLLRITIEREPVVKPKKSRSDKKHPAAGSRTEAMAPETASAQPKASPDSTDSPAIAAQTLRDALDRILAPSLDAAMLASLPDDWQLYYAAQRSGRAFKPDGEVLPASAVDRAARLLKVIDPPSNSYAQTNGIAGRALYRVVVDASGKPERIAIVRPIGFGLDENAVAAIRAASFAPAEKSGHPVAEALDVGVMFRIYSRLTDVSRTTEASNKEGASKAPPAPSKPLPGPYSVK